MTGREKRRDEILSRRPHQEHTTRGSAEKFNPAGSITRAGPGQSAASIQAGTTAQENAARAPCRARRAWRRGTATVMCHLEKSGGTRVKLNRRMKRPCGAVTV